MLSPNTLLNKARYRVERVHLSGPRSSVYIAVDQNASTKVLVVERATAEDIQVPTHEGLLRITDQFVMNGRRYDVTEPVEFDRPKKAIAKTWDDFSVVLMALNSLSAVSNKLNEICPQTVIATANYVYKLLPLESAGALVEIESWHVPMELIWSDLDHISQNAIYNAWDESSIADLERPLDESSDLYSIAAIFYEIFAGITPPSAFERTVVGLDESEPLVAPQALAPELGDEAGAYLLRCLELRRAMRFQSFEEAIMSLPTLSLSAKIEEPAKTEEDVVLLETDPLPQLSPVAETVVAKVDAMQTLAYAADEEIEAEVAPIPLEPRAAAAEMEDDELPTFTFEKAQGGRSRTKFVVAGVFVAVAGAVGFGAYQYSRNDIVPTPNAVSAQVTAPIVHTEPAAVPSPMPTEEVAITPATTTSENSTETAQPEPIAKADSQHPRPPTAAAKPATKIASASEPKAKKKVTVDDLINDN